MSYYQSQHPQSPVQSAINGMQMQPSQQSQFAPSLQSNVILAELSSMKYEARIMVEQLYAEIHRKQMNESTSLPDRLIPYTDRIGYVLVSGSKEYLGVTNFNVQSCSKVKIPNNKRVEYCYLLGILRMDKEVRHITITNEEFFKDSILRRKLMDNGCLVHTFGTKVKEKLGLANFRNYVIGIMSDSVELRMSGWTEDSGGCYTYNDLECLGELSESFGVKPKALTTVQVPNLKKLRDINNAFTRVEPFWVLLCWLIYAIIENYIPAAIKLNKLLVLKGNLNLCNEASLLLLKIFNRYTRNCDLTVFDDNKKVYSILSQAKDETVIITDMVKASTRNMQNNLSKFLNYLTGVFCHGNPICTDAQIKATATIISNNAIQYIDPMNLIVLHIDETSVDEDLLTICTLNSDPFDDLISLLTNYLSLKLNSISADLTDYYTNRIYEPDICNAFTSAERKKCFIVFEYLIKLYTKALYYLGSSLEFSVDEVSEILKGFFIKQDEISIDKEEVNNTDVLYLIKKALSELLVSGVCNIVEKDSDDEISPEKATVLYDRYCIYLKEDTLKNVLCSKIEKNISERQVLSVLESSGNLVTNNGVGYTYRVTINGERGHYIAIKRSFLDKIGEISILD